MSRFPAFFMRPAVALLLLAGCVDTVADDVVGHLGHMTVVALSDDCTPRRLDGDAGVQFLGRRPDGGLAFTIPQQLEFGPQRDGGALEGVQREQVPPVDGGVFSLGAESGCVALTGGWREFDGGLRLTQGWAGALECPSGPAYLPERACRTVREVRFEPMSECSQRCVKLSAGGEVSCECGR